MNKRKYSNGINGTPKEMDEIALIFTEIDEITYLKDQIRLTNAILRETHNPREFKQNKKYLERLERRLKLCQKQMK